MISGQLVSGVTRKRVGINSQGPVLRQHCKIIDDSGSPIGHITSGCPSPTLGTNIAMAYVPKDVCTEVDVAIRNRVIRARVSKIPFVPYAYYHE